MIRDFRDLPIKTIKAKGINRKQVISMLPESEMKKPERARFFTPASIFNK
jgi:hypothetical protein